MSNLDLHPWSSSEPWATCGRSLEAALPLLFDSTSVGISQWGPFTRRFQCVNAAMCTLTGYSEAELLAMCADDLNHPDERVRDRQRHDALCRDQASYRVEKRLLRRDGEVIWVAVNADLICDVDEQPLHMVAMMQDVTRRVLEERLAGEQQALLEKLATGCPVAECLTALTAAVSRLDVAVRACVLLTDETRQHFERTYAAEVPVSFGLGVERAPVCELAIGTCGAAVFSGKPVTCTDIAHDARWDARWRELCVAHGILACHSEPVFDANAQAIGSLMLCFDRPRAPSAWDRRIASFGTHVASIVLERERVARALLRSETRYRHIVEGATGFAIVTLDDAGCITSWNTGAGRMMGYAEADVLGRPGSVFFTSEDVARGEPQRELARAGARGRVENERWHVRADGSRFWAAGVVMALPGLGFLKIFRDRTGAREAEQERHLLLEAERAARADAELANRLKDEFLATLSHELRTPIANVVSWGHVLQKQFGAEDAQLARGLKVIVDNAMAQSRMIADLLDMSRIVSGKVHLGLQTQALGPLVEEAALAQRPAAEGRGLRLSIEVTELPLVALVDPVRIQQVLWNLLANAFKFTPAGGEVRVVLRALDHWAVLEVIDTGTGIDAAFLPLVFDRFRQAEAGASRRFGGLGLGLGIVRQLVSLHGGTVEAASEGYGRGARFTVRLPLVEADAGLRPPADDAASRPVAEALEPGCLASLRVLVVEDEPSMREVLARVLTDYGAEVTATSSAQEALTALHAGGAGRFDVLVSDLGLPCMDGLALIREVRRKYAAGVLPAVAVTAFARAEDRARALAVGFQAYLTKPYDVAELVTMLRRLCGPAAIDVAAAASAPAAPPERRADGVAQHPEPRA